MKDPIRNAGIQRLVDGVVEQGARHQYTFYNVAHGNLATFIDHALGLSERFEVTGVKHTGFTDDGYDITITSAAEFMTEHVVNSLARYVRPM